MFGFREAFGQPTPQRRAGHTISAATTFIV
jgi:hypothetical protein